jgi:hypothetical protein
MITRPFLVIRSFLIWLAVLLAAAGFPFAGGVAHAADVAANAAGTGTGNGTVSSGSSGNTAEMLDAVPAIVNLASCIQVNQKAAVVLLIDESGSLKKTDPEHRRLVAAKSAINALGVLGGATAGATTISVNVSTFGTGYHELVPWTVLTESSASAASKKIDVLRMRTNGIDTDYVEALLGAQQSLDALDAPCKAVMWFTDGKYDIETRRLRKLNTSYAPLATSAAGVVAAGKDLICAPNGLADQLRTSNIATIVVALTAGLEPADQEFLQALALGTGTTSTCGSISGTQTGAYFPANNLSELVSSFDRIGAQLRFGVQGASHVQVPVCVRVVCAEGTRFFPVDAGLSAVHLTTQTGGDGVNVVLGTPQGRVTFISGEKVESNIAVGRLTGRAIWLAPDVLTLDVVLPRDALDWSGEWSITLVKGGGANATVAPGFRVFYFSNIAARLASVTRDAAQVQLFDLLTNQPVAEAALATLRVALATGIDSNARLAPPVGERVGSLYTTALVVRAGFEGTANVVVDAQVTTASGIKLFATRSQSSQTFTIPPTLRDRLRSLITFQRMIQCLAGAAIAGLLITGWRVTVRRRSTLPPLRELQVVARPARIAFDAVGRHRVVWLASDGVESQFRLSSVSLVPDLPHKRLSNFEVGGVTFRKNARSGKVIASRPGSLMMTGSASGGLIGPGEIELTDGMSPVWIFTSDEPASTEARSSGELASPKGRAHIKRHTEIRRGDRCIDGMVVVSVTTLDQVAQIERSLLMELPGFARQHLRSEGAAA